MVEVWLVILTLLLVLLVGIFCFLLYQQSSLKRVRNFLGRLFSGSSVDEEKAILTRNDALDLSKESLVRCCKRGPARSDSTELSETPPDHHYHSQQPNHHGNSVTLAPLKTQVKIDLNSPTSVVRPEVQLQQPPITPTSSDTQAVSSMISPRRKKNCQEQPELPDYPASLDISADLEFPASGERRLSAISISSAVSDTSDEMFSEGEEIAVSHLQRAMSTDSIESTNSLNELISNDQSCGQLETKLVYDRMEKRLAIWVIQACELKVAGPNSETWVVVFLLPHAKPLWRTQLTKGAPNPQFHEKYEQKIREHDVRKFALLCQVYYRQQDKVQLIGQAKVRLKDLELTEGQTSWMNILPPKATECQDAKLGEVLFSLHWLPAAERLTVVIGKTKKIKKLDGSTPHNILVKAYLVQGPKKILKKKTSVKPLSVEGVASVNESMTFTLNQSYFHVHLRLSVVERLDNGDDLTVGHITVGGRCSEHWSQMVRSTPKPVPMWHPIMPKKSEF